MTHGGADRAAHEAGRLRGDPARSGEVAHERATLRALALREPGHQVARLVEFARLARPFHPLRGTIGIVDHHVAPLTDVDAPRDLGGRQLRRFAAARRDRRGYHTECQRQPRDRSAHAASTSAPSVRAR